MVAIENLLEISSLKLTYMFKCAKQFIRDLCSMLKVIIFVLLVSVIASLTTGFYFLVKDQGANSKKRLYYALGIRITLAAMLMGTLIYGIGTGQLGSQAPWDRELHPERLAPSNQAPTDP